MMIILSDISKLDERVVIDENGTVKRIWQYVPKTVFQEATDRPSGCLKDMKNFTQGFKLYVDSYVLTLENLNSDLETEYSSLEEFYATLNDKFLVI